MLAWSFGACVSAVAIGPMLGLAPVHPGKPRAQLGAGVLPVVGPVVGDEQVRRAAGTDRPRPRPVADFIHAPLTPGDARPQPAPAHVRGQPAAPALERE